MILNILNLCNVSFIFVGYLVAIICIIYIHIKYKKDGKYIENKFAELLEKMDKDNYKITKENTRLRIENKMLKTKLAQNPNKP